MQKKYVIKSERLSKMRFLLKHFAFWKQINQSQQLQKKQKKHELKSSKYSDRYL